MNRMKKLPLSGAGARHTSAKCRDCVFGRLVTTPMKGAFAGAEMCECHVARPTRYGFPLTRPDDYCSCHVDVNTNERTFAGLVPPSPSVII